MGWPIVDGMSYSRDQSPPGALGPLRPRCFGEGTVSPTRLYRHGGLRAALPTIGALGVLAIGVASVLVVAVRPTIPQGDQCEYVQMTYSLANHGSPELRLSDLRPLLDRCPGLWSLILEPTSPDFFGPY